MPALPDLRHVVPGWNENRWSDLLATLISTDPTPIASFIGTTPDRVQREVARGGSGGGPARRSDRLDLLLSQGGREIAAIEAKVLSDLGPDQLDRYAAAFPHAERHLVLHMASFPVHLGHARGWEAVTWEDLLTAYASSAHPWVATTAQAWLEQLHSLVPHVDEHTIWNAVTDDVARMELELRARTAWLVAQMGTWCSIEHDLQPSSGGGVWVAGMRTPAASAGHYVIAELQEGLASSEWGPMEGRTYPGRLRGPQVLVGLCQLGVDSSETFDWPLLKQVFSDPSIKEFRWMETRPQIRNVDDRASWQAMVAAGMPDWVGKGYGMATARTHHVCAFGARMQLAPTLTLGEIDAMLRSIEGLVTTLARVTHMST